MKNNITEWEDLCKFLQFDDDFIDSLRGLINISDDEHKISQILTKAASRLSKTGLFTFDEVYMFNLESNETKILRDSFQDREYMYTNKYHEGMDLLIPTRRPYQTLGSFVEKQGLHPHYIDYIVPQFYRLLTYKYEKNPTHDYSFHAIDVYEITYTFYNIFESNPMKGSIHSQSFIVSSAKSLLIHLRELINNHFVCYET